MCPLLEGPLLEVTLYTNVCVCVWKETYNRDAMKCFISNLGILATNSLLINDSINLILIIEEIITILIIHNQVVTNIFFVYICVYKLVLISILKMAIVSFHKCLLNLIKFIICSFIEGVIQDYYYYYYYYSFCSNLLLCLECDLLSHQM